MTSADAVLATALSPGDVITEVETPSGPWYTVLSRGEHHITVDGSQGSTGPPLPVTLPVAARDLVLRRSRC